MPKSSWLCLDRKITIMSHLSPGENLYQFYNDSNRCIKCQIQIFKFSACIDQIKVKGTSLIPLHFTTE